MTRTANASLFTDWQTCHSGKDAILTNLLNIKTVQNGISLSNKLSLVDCTFTSTRTVSLKDWLTHKIKVDAVVGCVLTLDLKGDNLARGSCSDGTFSVPFSQKQIGKKWFM